MTDKLIWAFLVGGSLCAIAQVLIDRTSITPARIMVIYVVTGAALTFFGIYENVVKLAGAGATVPIIGFGYSVAKGTIKAVTEKGAIGILTGGLTQTSAGICAAILFAYIVALIRNPRSK
ncbi:MAG: stage V sporulation protein AE [Ruminococcaceae bacterium]|nr:stage V sporulation protein AE [Oscillospiraceae bacterium]